MPLYEYFCDSCKQEFTLLQSANVDKSATECPECKHPARHQFSTFASKVEGQPMFKSGSSRHITENDLPNKNVMNLPIPRLRSEL